MPSGPSVWAYVIGWTGHEEHARQIAAAIEDHVDRLVVVYSHRSGTPHSGAGEWRQVSDDLYYGGKFATALDDFDGDVMLHVQADASADWPRLAGACRDAFATREGLGVWSPVIDYSPMSVETTSVRVVDGMHRVAVTDSVVWALSREVCDWFRTLDPGANTYGFGFEGVAAAHCHVAGLEVVVDPSVPVKHPRSRGYDSTRALQIGTQWSGAALTPAESTVHELLWAYVHTRWNQTWLRPLLAMTATTLASRVRTETTARLRALTNRLRRG